MDPPVKWFVKKLLTQGQRTGQFAMDPRFTNADRWGCIQKTTGDFRMWVHCDHPHLLAINIPKARKTARLNGFCAAIPRDLIGENPRRAFAPVPSPFEGT